jgi:RNA polymerase sigma-70 factor, ECF subfamily
MGDHRTTPPGRFGANVAPDAARAGDAHDDSDAALLSRCASGDQAAFMTIHERFAPRVYGLIVALLGQGGRADDAFQDAMYEIWSRAPSYNPCLGPADSWMLMIARSRALDVMRRERRRAAAHERARDRVERPTRDADPQPLAEPGARERLGAVARLLSELPSEQSTAIRMAFVSGLSRDEIAGALGVPVGTVKTRIRAGITAIARALAMRESGPGAEHTEQRRPR